MPVWLRRVLPWVVGAAFLVYLFQRVPWEDSRRALATGPYLEMTVFIVFQVTVTLLADGWASAVSLAAAGVRRPTREVTLVRGATYLLGLVNYALGQGGLGVYLHRKGVPGRQASGAVLYLIVINGIVLVGLAAIVWPFARGPVRPAILMVIGAAVAILSGALVLVARRFGHLREHALVAPWLVAGVGGVLRSVVARLLHVAVLVVGLWAVFRVWGIPVPFVEGLLRMPVVLLVAALPISPSGLGTTQTAQVLLFAEFATDGTAAGRESTILAAGLVYYAVGVSVQVILAALCMMRLRRERIDLAE